MSSERHSQAELPRSDAVELTIATMADFDFLFELKSEPDSVYWGGFAQPPEHSSLKRHYEQLFGQGVKTTLIIRCGGASAGTISYRFDEAGDCVDYSINIASRFAGRGLGQAALTRHIAMLTAAFPACRRIVAKIREDNPRSQRIFSACGYVQTGDFEERVLDSDPKPIRLVTWVKSLA